MSLGVWRSSQYLEVPVKQGHHPIPCPPSTAIPMKPLFPVLVSQHSQSKSVHTQGHSLRSFFL